MISLPTPSRLLAAAIAGWARATLTAASRITIPAYPALYTTVGLLFILQDPTRTSGSAFDVARMLLPIPWYGVAFVVIGFVEAAAALCLTSRNPDVVETGRRSYLQALRLGAGMAGFWTVLLLAAAFSSEQVSYTSAVWLAGITVFHVASARSLARGEGGRP